jgi:hypothetical protein
MVRYIAPLKSAGSRPASRAPVCTSVHCSAHRTGEEKSASSHHISALRVICLDAQFRQPISVVLWNSTLLEPRLPPELATVHPTRPGCRSTMHDTAAIPRSSVLRAFRMSRRPLRIQRGHWVEEIMEQPGLDNRHRNKDGQIARKHADLDAAANLWPAFRPSLSSGCQTDRRATPAG